MQKVTPFLWFNNNAEEAMDFYNSIFKNSSVLNKQLLPEGAPGTKERLLMGVFKIEGQEFMVLNGGPLFTFNEAISLFVSCDTQEEIDEYWERLTEGGSESQCGWLKDKFGLSWQIITKTLGELMSDSDPVKAERVMNAMLRMKKIDMAELQRAYDGE